MVCREDQASTCRQSLRDAWQLTVEVDQSCRVSGGAGPMSVLRPAVAETRGAKSPALASEPFDGARDALVVVGCSLPRCNTLAAEYVADLADAARRNAGIF